MELNFVDEFTYLGCRISTNGNNTDEITSVILKNRAVYGNLHHLWCRMDIALTTNGHLYGFKVHPALIYDCETCPICAEDLHWL